MSDDTPQTKTHYMTLHWRTSTQRGPAKLQKCVHCAANGIDKQASDWAQIHGTDGENVMDYMPLCRKCHIAYDGSGHRTPHSEETKALLSQKNTGYKHTPEAVEKIRIAALNPSDEARAKMAAGGRKSAEMRRGKPMPAEQRAKISASLKGNTNSAVSGRVTAPSGSPGKRTGQALENIRAGQQRRRDRERAEREAAAGEA